MDCVLTCLYLFGTNTLIGYIAAAQTVVFGWSPTKCVHVIHVMTTYNT